MRIKITGYIDTDDLDADQVDEGHSTGLSDEGYQSLIFDADGKGLRVADLSDVDAVRA
jgi:hypothetical protein